MFAGLPREVGQESSTRNSNLPTEAYRWDPALGDEGVGRIPTDTKQCSGLVNRQHVAAPFLFIAFDIPRTVRRRHVPSPPGRTHSS
jgi:hypothetical protein